MAEKRVMIVLHADGSIEMNGQNFSGPECEKAMADLQKLFKKDYNEQKKPEYYQRQQTKVRQ